MYLCVLRLYVRSAYTDAQKDVWRGLARSDSVSPLIFERTNDAEPGVVNPRGHDESCRYRWISFSGRPCLSSSETLSSTRRPVI